ncbi:MAG: hypothetical protein LAN84_07130 [Acidobacteriia bacterium]|nr:hypothetical protein [Terriglobia bacterium]
MRSGARFTAMVILLTLVSGPLLSCCLAQPIPAEAKKSCAQEMEHNCGPAVSSSAASCCTISADGHPYLAGSAETQTAPEQTSAATVPAAANFYAAGAAMMAQRGELFLSRSSPPESISVLRI